MLQGGALGVCFNTPFDVVKSRMQDTTQKVPHTSIDSSLRSKPSQVSMLDPGTVESLRLLQQRETAKVW